MFLQGAELARFVSPLTRGAVQPAGVDLSLWEVEELSGSGFVGVGGRSLPPGRPVEPGDDGVYRLAPGVYRIRFREAVRVPLWAVGLCFPRSSLLRMGVLVGCAVWDPGYVGRGQALLAVLNPHGFEVERGARIAQLVYARLEGVAAAGYTGSYQGEGLRVARSGPRGGSGHSKEAVGGAVGRAGG